MKEAEKQDPYTLTSKRPSKRSVAGGCAVITTLRATLAHGMEKEIILAISLHTAHDVRRCLMSRRDTLCGITPCISWEDELGRINICLLAYQIRGQRRRFGNMERGYGIMIMITLKMHLYIVAAN